MPDDDPDLAAAIAGDADAMSRLWRAHRRVAAAVAAAHHVPVSALEDVLQEVAVAFVAHLRELREPGAFRGWLRTIAMHAALAFQRGERRRRQTPLLEAATDELADPRPPIAAGDAVRERLDSVLAAIARMQPEYREPMWLRTVQGLTQQQIADTLGVPVTTVETRLARARRMLRATFAVDLPQPDDPAARCTPPPTRS